MFKTVVCLSTFLLFLVCVFTLELTASPIKPHPTQNAVPDNFVYVSKLEYEQILTDDLPLDVNPATNPGGGVRIFPDKKTPAETVDRRKIKVKAQYSQATAGVRIYFRNFDVDDPSADVAPIDANDTASVNTGNDNNGNVDGTAATRGGLLSVPAAGQPNPYNCQPFSNSSASGVSCETDSTGVAKVDFTVTMQPGDNFAVAAGPDETYVSELTSADDGINLKDGNNIQLPFTATGFGGKNQCLNTSLPACRTLMLTVWRRLHIEVDSMDLVTGNRIEGEIPTGGQAPVGNVQIDIEADKSFDVNRFQNGRMVIGGQSYLVVSNSVSTPPVAPSTVHTGSIVIQNPNAFNIDNGEEITVYDDDDFNDDDSTGKDGDIGEDVDLPPDDLVRSSDVSCSTTLTTNCNSFGPAYVKPYYDLVGSHDDTYFVTNVNVSGNPAIPQPPEIRYHFDFDNEVYEAREDFWTVYVNGAYQYDVRVDGDPSGTAVLGAVDSLTGDGEGVLIFMETTRSSENPNPNSRPISRAYTVAHELGHLFSGRHDDYFPLGSSNPSDAGLMSATLYRTSGVFNPVTISKIRGGEINGIRVLHP